jgi:hypothetical protein
MRTKKRPVVGSRLSYSISRLVKVCDVSRTVIYQEIAAGHLIARKIGRRTVVRRSDAIRWLQGLPRVVARQLAPGDPLATTEDPTTPPATASSKP